MYHWSINYRLAAQLSMSHSTQDSEYFSFLRKQKIALHFLFLLQMNKLQCAHFSFSTPCQRSQIKKTMHTQSLFPPTHKHPLLQNSKAHYWPSIQVRMTLAHSKLPWKFSKIVTRSFSIFTLWYWMSFHYQMISSLNTSCKKKYQRLKMIWGPR